MAVWKVTYRDHSAIARSVGICKVYFAYVHSPKLPNPQPVQTRLNNGFNPNVNINCDFKTSTFVK